MSPREVYREMEAANVRRQDEVAAQKQLAWATANYTALALVGKLPSADEVHGRTKNGLPVKQSRKEFATTVRLLSERYGIPIRQRVH